MTGNPENNGALDDAELADDFQTVVDLFAAGSRLMEQIGAKLGLSTPELVDKRFRVLGEVVDDRLKRRADAARLLKSQA